jgi:hypothetical protein
MAGSTTDADVQGIDDETWAILQERLKTFDEDVKAARPWSQVKADLLRPGKERAQRSSRLRGRVGERRSG